LLCRAVILNAMTDAADLAQRTNPGILGQLTEVPILEVEYGQQDFARLVNHVFSGSV
ncbi:MAG: hypothetical protein JO069_02925, partial [Verrucomicrobia bacterium]|nr:hypothetical protein [Verrucomicrobiota bacterium]